MTFVGNTRTKDYVIRRELRLYEGGVFNTEALKFSVRRLNQLGYFKPIEDQRNVQVTKTSGADNKVDVTLKLEEQNRNQLNFGAGFAEYSGPFVNFSYATMNLLGGGESLSFDVQTGTRSNNYSITATEPYVFSRPISFSGSAYSRKMDYYTNAAQAVTVYSAAKGFTQTTGSSKSGYSEVTEGVSATVGRGLAPFTRLFTGILRGNQCRSLRCDEHHSRGHDGQQCNVGQHHGRRARSVCREPDQHVDHP